MDSPILGVIIVLLGLLALSILWLATFSVPADPSRHGFTRRGRSFLLHLSLLIVLPFVNGFAFLPLFADHAPWPAPFDNLQVLAIVELLVLGALYAWLVFGFGRLYRRWMMPERRRTILQVLVSLAIASTLLPVILAAVAGPA